MTAPLVSITWYGQAGFLLEAGSVQVLIDPFFSPHPARTYSPSPERWDQLSLVLCTHEHLDHLDAPFIRELLASGVRAEVVVPEPVLPVALAAGIDAERVLGAVPGTPIERGGVIVHPVRAFHGVGGEVPVEYGFNHPGDPVADMRFLGFVVEIGDLRVYHSGDTLLYPGMAEELRALRPDVMLVPINGRDFMRERSGCVGNLNEAEAAWLCAEVGARFAIPMHYETMADNLGDVGRFVVALGSTGAPVTTVVLPRAIPVPLARS